MSEVAARVEAAYAQAEALIDHFRRRIAAGENLDLAPVGAAIVALCAAVRGLPAQQANPWAEPFSALQRRLLALGAEVEAAERARREGSGDGEGRQ